MTTDPEPALNRLTPDVLQRLSPTELAEQLNGQVGELQQRLGIRLLEASPARLVARMPVEGNRQPAMRLHGGASAALVEDLASLGSWLNLDVSRQVAVGVDLNITHVRGAVSGEVQAEAELTYRGRSVMVWTVTIRNEHGKVTSVGRCTCNVVNR
ncbi:PaaI family thioesterase [Deinococcus sonorensis]|uniref:PaaI family thioesterase n=2 Tax=Deinococcus sonorensis TaxID=309891 RepID=A0AAU7UC02_9DEIO